MPREVFVREEFPLLRAAPKDQNDVPHWATPMSIRTITFKYSVPTRFVGNTGPRPC